MSMTVGQWVRCERDASSRGTWLRYAGRVGRVVILNERDKEIGVRFTADTAESASWFVSTELVVVERPKSAPPIRIEPERARQSRVVGAQSDETADRA